MPKPRQKISVRLPMYSPPRLAWRQQILDTVLKEQKRRGVVYLPSDRIEVRVKLYFGGSALTTHDVDNRMKDVFDALQGRLGGPKRVRPVNPVIPNDRQIWRLIAEKCSPPKQSLGLGHLTIRVYPSPKGPRQ